LNIFYRKIEAEEIVLNKSNQDKMEDDNKTKRIKVVLEDSWELLTQNHKLFDTATFKDYWHFMHENNFIVYITSNFGKLNGVRFSTSYYATIRIEVDETHELQTGADGFKPLILKKRYIKLHSKLDDFIQNCYIDKE